jgi:hypothetical protein
MRVTEQLLHELKRRAQANVEQAVAYGDPDEITEAKELVDLADDLIKRNGKLTPSDRINLQILSGRLGGGDKSH